MLEPFYVWDNKTLKKIDPVDVLCLIAEKNYTKIILPDKAYLVRSTLSNTLKKLPPDIFIKIHRSIAVSIYHVDSIKKDHLLVGDEPIPIGKQFYKSLIEKLNIIE